MNKSSSANNSPRYRPEHKPALHVRRVVGESLDQPANPELKRSPILPQPAVEPPNAEPSPQRMRRKLPRRAVSQVRDPGSPHKPKRESQVPRRIPGAPLPLPNDGVLILPANPSRADHTRRLQAGAKPSQTTLSRARTRSQVDATTARRLSRIKGDFDPKAAPQGASKVPMPKRLQPALADPPFLHSAFTVDDVPELINEIFDARPFAHVRYNFCQAHPDIRQAVDLLMALSHFNPRAANAAETARQLVKDYLDNPGSSLELPPALVKQAAEYAIMGDTFAFHQMLLGGGLLPPGQLCVMEALCQQVHGRYTEYLEAWRASH